MVLWKWLVSISLSETFRFQGILTLFCIFTSFARIYGENHTCVKQDSCSCRQYNGIIDLHSLGTPNEPTFFKDKNDFKYYYNPCFNFTLKSDKTKTKCSDVAACRYSNMNESYEDLGKQNSVEFGYNVTRGKLFVKYASASGNTTTTVYLMCNTETGFDVQAPLKKDTYEFELSSPCACPGGCPMNALSTGTILCIIFIILVSSYFVVGILYKKAVHGAVGTDIIPNAAFWTSLPSLIKDGYLFFISPCLGDKVEYKSYERL